MKGVIARLVSLAIGALSLYLLLFVTENTASSVVEFVTRFAVISCFLIYGFGGNKALAKIVFLEIFSKPISKEHIYNLAKPIGQSKA
jgi:hypothetical protein